LTSHRLDLSGRRLYLCTPDRPDLEHFVEECVAGGVDIVQLRDKQLEARQQLVRGRALQRVCESLGVPFILNDRPDLALECGADGVHVGQDDAPPALARRILGADRLVGFSTHAESELEAALSEPVDYVSVGPVVETPTKPGRPGTGAGYVGRAGEILHRAVRPLPFFVTGGVTPETIPPLWELGARRFVVVRYLTSADDPRVRARELSEAIERLEH
jgi:thiamine-phosphate pyrophosphorylase